VQVPTGTFRVLEPGPDRLGLVGREAVEDDVDVELSWDMEIDQLEEGQHVGALVRGPRVIEDLASPDVHRSEKVGRAIALVVVGHGSRSTRCHGKRLLGAVEGLDHGSSRRS
jgi:hypothetical protein